MRNGNRLVQSSRSGSLVGDVCRLVISVQTPGCHSCDTKAMQRAPGVQWNDQRNTWSLVNIEWVQSKKSIGLFVIIAKHPLENSLDHLWDSLWKAEQFYEPGSISYDGAGDNSNQGPLKAVSRLLSTFQSHNMAPTLRSKTRMEI